MGPLFNVRRGATQYSADASFHWKRNAHDRSDLIPCRFQKTHLFLFCQFCDYSSHVSVYLGMTTRLQLVKQVLSCNRKLSDIPQPSRTPRYVTLQGLWHFVRTRIKFVTLCESLQGLWHFVTLQGLKFVTLYESLWEPRSCLLHSWEEVIALFSSYTTVVSSYTTYTVRNFVRECMDIESVCVFLLNAGLCKPSWIDIIPGRYWRICWSRGGPTKRERYVITWRSMQEVELEVRHYSYL